MKKFKDQKGITLIALIITIILLLILAIVTISAVNEGNLFAHANNAATKYQEEAKLENTKITEWVSKMEQYDSSSEEGGSLTFSDIAGTYWLNGDSSTKVGGKFNTDGTFEMYTSDNAPVDGPNVFYGTYTISGNTIDAFSPDGYIGGGSVHKPNIRTIITFNETDGTKVLTCVQQTLDGVDYADVRGAQLLED